MAKKSKSKKSKTKKLKSKPQLKKTKAKPKPTVPTPSQPSAGTGISETALIGEQTPTLPKISGRPTRPSVKALIEWAPIQRASAPHCDSLAIQREHPKILTVATQRFNRAVAQARGANN